VGSVLVLFSGCHWHVGRPIPELKLNFSNWLHLVNCKSHTS
jgi:hypothetical protein